MTTTAEKINQCCIKLDDLRDKIEELEEEIQKLRSDNSKPPDPEPLECWLPENALHSAPMYCYETVQEARSIARNSQVFHMREVTPEMLENEKDAKRFRRLTEMAGVAWQPGDTEWSRVVPGSLLRRELDEMMENEK